MRTLGIIALMVGMASATVAHAQSMGNFGWGSSARGAGGGGGGSESQQQGGQNGLSAVKKAEEKRFPLGAAWIAVSLNGKPYSGSERPAFRLDDQFRVHGFGGCNSFSTTAYPLRQQGIAVGPLALTKRSCDKGVMATEMAFLTALRTSAKWDSQVGTLIIKGPNGEIRFERSL